MIIAKGSSDIQAAFSEQTLNAVASVSFGQVGVSGNQPFVFALTFSPVGKVAPLVA